MCSWLLSLSSLSFMCVCVLRGDQRTTGRQLVLSFHLVGGSWESTLCWQAGSKSCYILHASPYQPPGEVFIPPPNSHNYYLLGVAGSQLWLLRCLCTLSPIHHSLWTTGITEVLHEVKVTKVRVKNKFTKPVLIHLPSITVSQSPGIKHSDFGRLSSGECKNVDSFRD